VRAFVVRIPATSPDQTELAADRLWQLGVRAVEERRVGSDTELWTSVGESDSAIARALAMLGSSWDCRTVDIDDSPAETWREYARPIWVSPDIVIVPAWQQHELGDDPLVIQVEPGAAFGLGDHSTTRLSVGAVARLLRCRGDGPMVLDVGCGTGVVAITAALLGGNPVRAVDISSAAVEAAQHNAEINGVGNAIEIDTTPVVDLNGTYEIVVANILAPVLISLAPDLRRLTAPGGSLVISGVLAEAHEHVVAALAPMKVIEREIRDGWAAVTLQH